MGWVVLIAIWWQANNLEAFAHSIFGEKATHAAGGYQDSFIRWISYFSPFTRVPEFLLGCISASVFLALKKYPIPLFEQIFGNIISVSMCIIVILHFYWLYIISSTSESAWIQAISYTKNSNGLAPTIAVFLFFIARYESIVKRFLSLKYIVLGGEVSYSAYLLHMPIIFAFRWEAAKVTSFQVFVGDFIRLLFVLGCVFGLAFVTWAIVEMPARRAIIKSLSLKTRYPDRESPIKESVN